MQREYELKVGELKEDVFFETFGNGTRLELKNGAFSIGKLAIGLQQFDVNTNKQKEYICCYMDIEKALSLSHDILSGMIAKEALKCEWPNAVRVFQGGQPAEKANRPDKKPLYRDFSITKGKLWVLKGQEGPGKVNSKGGFAPDGKSEKSVSVGISSDTLRTMAIMIQMEYQAYRTAQYYYTLKKQERN